MYIKIGGYVDTYILYCIAPPWGLFCHTEIKKIKDRNIYNIKEKNERKKMWIGSTIENKAKPLGIRWPNEPIIALGVYYMYDVKLLREKNFIERLDSIKKLINIWSFLIPKFVYMCVLLPTPMNC